jgi:hypothetical protein
MASLTETAYHTRRAINWGILGIGIFILLRILWSVFLTLIVVLFPPKPPPPNHAFNKLPRLEFPAPLASPAAQLTFTLETITGDLPVFASNSAVVYSMPKQSSSLLSVNNAQAFVRRLEFNQTPAQLSRTIYQFTDISTPLRTIQYDIVSNNFVLRYAYNSDTGLFTEGTIRDQRSAINQAIDFLRQNNLYQADFAEGEKVVTNLRLVGNQLIPTENLSETDAMQVNFFRGSINGLPLYTPDPTQGLVQITFSGARSPKKQIIEAIYTYWPIERNISATYSLRTVEEAWQDLQNGRGFIARYPINGDTNAVIRTVDLAYYDSFQPQTYLQPIYVFRGDHEFAAYVSAVRSEWIE